MNLGVLYGIIAFVIWGLYPLYWTPLQSIPALQLACHRIVWSFVIMLAILTWKQEWSSLRSSMTLRVFGIYTLSSIFIFANWYILVWGINSGYILQTSLGNFINPLISVMFGVVIFKETLRHWQWVAVILATSGIIVVAIAYNLIPWIALSSATSFAIYGLIKKYAPLNALHGLMIETAILTPPSLVYIITTEVQGVGAFLHVSLKHNIMLVGGGVVTIVPLLLFSSAAQLIALSLLGIIAYVSPMIRFFIGTFMYHESLDLFQLCGFILVWIALVIFTVESFVQYKKPVAGEPSLSGVDPINEDSYEDNPSVEDSTPFQRV